MPELKIKLPDEIHQKLKELAKDDERSLAQYIIRGLKYLSEMPTPYHKLLNINTAPQIYIPPATTTEVQPQAQIIDISSLKGLQKEEYARKLMAEAKTEKAELKEEARAEAHTLSPEEQQLEQQKLDIQKQKLQEKRDKLLRDKAIELDLWDAENYNEERVISSMCIDYGMWRKDEFKNKPIEELYEYMKKVKQEEDEEQAERDRRDALPHDAHNYDYKSEDFERDVKRLQEIYLEDYAYADPSYEEEDYKILYNYYFKTCEYREFEQKMNHPDYAFDEDDIKLSQSIFNSNNIDID